MKINMRVLSVLMLMLASSGLVAQTHTNSNSQKKASARTVTPGAKSQEQILLEQLNDKFQKLDDLNQKYDDLQRRFDLLEKQLAERDAALKNAQNTAVAAALTQRSSEAPSASVTVLQNEVETLKTSSTALRAKVESAERKADAMEHPDVLHFKGIDFKPGGFIAAETVDRQRGVGGDVNTPFNSIPFAGQTAGVLSEFNAGGRQSRLSLLAEGKLPSATLRAYYETDFLSAGATSNDNQSNSYTLRQRQAWAQMDFHSGWLITAGQMWSLATEYRHGLVNNAEAIPQTIDAQYNAGFTWERQYGFRVVKHYGDRLWLGGSVEEAQTLNIGGHNLPTIAYQQAGNGGGLYNSTANYSFNYAPDLIGKMAYEPSWGHLELFGVGRFFRSRVFPNGPNPPGAAPATTTSALGAFTAKAQGGGIGANARVMLFSKKLEIGAHALVGNGVGRYGSSTLPDATAHPDGSLALLTGGSALGSLEWHAAKRMDLYGYYGGEYAHRAYYAYPQNFTDTVTGQLILAGYGAPTNNVSGCSTEVLPVSSPNGGGNVPGTATNCVADTRNIQEGTLGWWFRFYRGTHGTFQQGFQYSYAVRHTWQGVGNPTFGITGSPKAIDNMFFTSFRYYLPQ